MNLFYDFHIHSCLSPCGDADMTPNNIVNMALLQELDVIAVADHNTAAQLPSVFQVANQTPLLVIPAIEVCTNEEVHVLCLFETLEDCLRFSQVLYDSLPPIDNQPEIFGEQWILSTEDEPVEQIVPLLLNAVSFGIDELLEKLPHYRGHAIPAHVDRQSYSIISNLGFIPPDYAFPCVEVRHPPYDFGIEAQVITDSDAHYLENIAGRDRALEVEEKSIVGVLRALGFTCTT